MVASARSFFGDHTPRRPDRPAKPSFRDMLADGSLGSAMIGVAEHLSTLGAAIDLALAEADIADIADIGGLDDPRFDAILDELGMLPPDRVRRHRPDAQEPNQ